jgi:CDP-diacylglycerol--glycerol-3-phosphate 3-phosphatidyltransferase/archaetidylinositol phosphate synthase
MLGKLRAKYEQAMQPIGRSLGRLGVTPNTITTVSLILALLAGFAYAMKMPLLGALGLVSSGIVDMLDGAMARATGKITRFGAVYDPVADRYAEFFVLVGIALGGFVEWFWVVFALFGMVMASYTRARAESSGGLKSCAVGIAERQEKIILLLVGSILQPFIGVALFFSVVIVGVLSHITVVQRLQFTWKQTSGEAIHV